MFASINRPDWRGGAANMGPIMRYIALIILLSASTITPVSAQMNTDSAHGSMTPYFEQINKCLADVDTKARAKKLSVDSYKLVLEGSCTQEILAIRQLYSLRLERDEDQQYFLKQFDNNIKDGRAKMVASYAMR